jgi:hypothetical protein
MKEKRAKYVFVRVIVNVISDKKMVEACNLLSLCE